MKPLTEEQHKIERALLEALRLHDDGLLMSRKREWIRGMVVKDFFRLLNANTAEPDLENMMMQGHDALVDEFGEGYDLGNVSDNTAEDELWVDEKITSKPKETITFKAKMKKVKKANTAEDKCPECGAEHLGCNHFRISTNTAEQWISVEDRLPERYKQVVCFGNKPITTRGVKGSFPMYSILL